MAPNKFEKHIKKQLQEREIRPSADAWGKISEQLEVAEGPKAKNFFRYAIAAVFVGFLMVSIWYFNTDDSIFDTQTVVKETPVDPIEKQQQPESLFEEKTDEDAVFVKQEINSETTVPTIPSQKTEEVLRSQVASVEEKNEALEKVNIASSELISIKIEEIIAQVDLLEKENALVTDAEINALLLQAQQEIVENPIFRKDSSVDASALLADVEDELDKSFRDQIFDALKDGFVKVRTAVADRNK